MRICVFILACAYIYIYIYIYVLSFGVLSVLCHTFPFSFFFFCFCIRVTFRQSRLNTLSPPHRGPLPTMVRTLAMVLFQPNPSGHAVALLGLPRRASAIIAGFTLDPGAAVHMHEEGTLIIMWANPLRAVNMNSRRFYRGGTTTQGWNGIGFYNHIEPSA